MWGTLYLLYEGMKTEVKRTITYKMPGCQSGRMRRIANPLAKAHTRSNRVSGTKNL